MKGFNDHPSAPETLSSVDALLTRLKLRHLLLMEALIELGSVRAAARRLGMAQPVASVLLREIEHVFGRPMFERSRVGVVPLPPALALVARTRVALATLRSAVEETVSGDQPELKLGLVPNAMLTIGPGLIGQLHERDARLRVLAVVEQARSLIRQVLDGTLDAAIARVPAPELATAVHAHCEVVQLPADDWCVVGRQDGLTASGASGKRGKARQQARTAEQWSRGWVLPGEESQMFSILREACMRAGVPVPKAAVVVDGMQNCLAIATQTPLITICNRSMFKHPLAAQMEEIDVGLRLQAPPLALFFRRESRGLPALRALRELVESVNVKDLGAH